MSHSSPENGGGSDRFERLLAFPDKCVYILVAVLFLLAAVGMAVFSAVTLVQHVVQQGFQDFPQQLVVFINGLLLVLIIMEVLDTIRGYLSTGHTSLQPFLYIGIISATRRILTIGAEATLGQANSEMAFRRQIIDLGVNGAVVLALAAALYLIARRGRRGDFEELRDADC